MKHPIPSPSPGQAFAAGTPGPQVPGDPECRSYLAFCKVRVEKTLDRWLPPAQEDPARLHEAMRYSVLSGGKRLRAAFIYAAGQGFGADIQVLDEVSAAFECGHGASLIHDDLPAIDNDDLRRGRPSCHVAFGEATAIIAGDALVSLAFEILSGLDRLGVNPRVNLEMLRIFADATGARGLAGGEELDIQLASPGSPEHLEKVYRLKTANYISAALCLGALAAGCDDAAAFGHLRQFGICTGIAFQIHDDIIGIESDSEVLGKTRGQDARNGKPVYPLVAGIRPAKARRDALFQEGIAHLDQTGCARGRLLELARFALTRSH